MFAKYFEDIRIGEQAAFGSHVFTAEEIKSFAKRYDYQDFHTDEDKAKNSMFGALCASGWHTAAVCQKLAIAHRTALLGSLLDNGKPRSPQLGPSTGLKNIRWLRPVFANDEISYSARVCEKRELRSKPDWGLLVCRFEGHNRDNLPVYEVMADFFVERRKP